MILIIRDNVNAFADKSTNRNGIFLAFIAMISFNRVHWARRKTRGRNGERLVSFALTVVSWPAYFRFVCRSFAVVSFFPPVSPETFRASLSYRTRSPSIEFSRTERKEVSPEEPCLVTSSTRARRSAVLLRDFLKITE